jgi:hypothetical protein
MGGQRETVVSKSTGDPAVVGGFRIHEEKGEVHFHDDKNGLKCSVPPATWFNAWSRLLGEKSGSEWNYADPVNGTILTVRLEFLQKRGQKEKVLVHLEMRRAEFSDDFAKLQKFTQE